MAVWADDAYPEKAEQTGAKEGEQGWGGGVAKAAQGGARNLVTAGNPLEGESYRHSYKSILYIQRV